MTAIAEKVRAEHRLDGVQGCICGTKHTGGKGWWSKHIATVTEQATRAQIAADIAYHEHDRQAAKDSAWLHSVDWVEGFDHAIGITARIARGEVSS